MKLTQKMPIAFTAQSKRFFYCQDVVCAYTLQHGFIPLNPFRVFGYFLDDRVETVHGKASIASMHLAKGLEFRGVVVMACDDEIIPLQERIETVGTSLANKFISTILRQLTRKVPGGTGKKRGRARLRRAA